MVIEFFYRILHRRSLILLCFVIIYLNRVLIIGQIIRCCCWSNMWWFIWNGWYTIDNGGGKGKFIVATVLWSLLTCNFHVVVSCSTHILYLMCVCDILTIFLHWIAYVIRFWRNCSFLIGYQEIYLFFILICGITSNISDLFWRKKRFNFSKSTKKVYH